MYVGTFVLVGEGDCVVGVIDGPAADVRVGVQLAAPGLDVVGIGVLEGLSVVAVDVKFTVEVPVTVDGLVWLDAVPGCRVFVPVGVTVFVFAEIASQGATPPAPAL